MEVTVLGSGVGTPSLKRCAAAVYIKINEKNLLFDTGPGALRKLLQLGITYHDLDDIFYTHLHTDHTLDLAAILFAAKYALSLRTRPLKLFGAQGLAAFYHGLLSLYGDVLRPEAYEVKLREIAEQTLEFSEYKINTLRMQHTPESLGYRIEANGKCVVYSGDTDVCENIVRLGKDADVLILDCSFPNQMKVTGHLIPQEAGEIAQAANCKKLILTHFYPVCQEEEVVQQARSSFGGEVAAAYDLMSVEL